METIVRKRNRLVQMLHRLIDRLDDLRPAPRRPGESTLLVPLMYPEVVSCRAPSYQYRAVRERLDLDQESIARCLALIRPFCTHPNYARIAEGDAAPGEPSRRNGWFEAGDAAALYGMVAATRPRRIIEIGSGHSTKFMRRALRDFSIDCHLTSIDPHPRAEIDALCDRVVRSTVLEADLALFRELEPGDILFHDGSHLTFNGTDTVALFLEILPQLRPGVLVHVHDICLPHEYYFDHRGYSEQYMLATALLFSARLEVVLPVGYLAQQGRFEPGVSFWFRMR